MRRAPVGARRSSKGIGSSESPAQAVARHDARDGAPTASLTFAAKAETIVVDDDAATDPARLGHRRPARDAWPGPARLLQGPGTQRAHVRRDRRRALVAARRHGHDRRRRHGAPARSRLAVHQHRRREGVPGRGRGGAEGARPASHDAVVVGVARRALRPAGRRDRRAGDRCAVTRTSPCSRRTAARTSPATRSRARCTSSTRCAGPMPGRSTTPGRERSPAPREGTRLAAALLGPRVALLRERAAPARRFTRPRRTTSIPTA